MPVHIGGLSKKKGKGRLLPSTIDVSRVRDLNHAAVSKVCIGPQIAFSLL